MRIFNLNLINMNAVDIIMLVNYIFITLLGVLSAYRFLFIVLGFFKAPRYKKSTDYKNYAFLISARNEEKVIGNLVKSIKKQKYPQDKITVFVVADNCTDKTAEKARDAGAVVYERFNNEFIGKGYALNFLTKHIIQDYGSMKAFDGYFIIDADNVLDGYFVEKMNDAFSAGNKVVRSYISSKNFGSNFISAGYGYHHLRIMRTLHIPRTKLNLSCTVNGTGVLISSEILEANGGWTNLTITEDIEFSIDTILKGYQIVNCYDAILYDEQPTTFKVMFRQRIRWAKGYLIMFKTHTLAVLKKLFRCKISEVNDIYGDKQNKQTWAQRKFTLYDMAFQIFPYSLVVFIWKLMYFIALIIAQACLGMSVVAGLSNLGIAFLQSFLTLYLTSFIQVIPVTIIEWKRIACSNVKKILYMFTFPIFDLFSLPITFIALFSNVTWKPIEHKDTTTIDTIEEIHKKYNKKHEE